MQQTARTLEQLGAGCLCAPCVTSHYFYRELAGGVSIPLSQYADGNRTGTESCWTQKGSIHNTGTVSTGLFQNALEACGLSPPCLVTAKKLVMSLIYDEIKAGRPADPEKVRNRLP